MSNNFELESAVQEMSFKIFLFFALAASTKIAQRVYLCHTKMAARAKNIKIFK